MFRASPLKTVFSALPPIIPPTHSSGGRWAEAITTEACIKYLRDRVTTYNNQQQAASEWKKSPKRDSFRRGCNSAEKLIKTIEAWSSYQRTLCLSVTMELIRRVWLMCLRSGTFDCFVDLWDFGMQVYLLSMLNLMFNDILIIIDFDWIFLAQKNQYNFLGTVRSWLFFENVYYVY